MQSKIEYKDIPLESIEISPANVRKDEVEEGLDELAQSIAEIGLQQPVVVYPKGERYQLVIGQRRYIACKRLGWKEIPALIRSVKSETCAKVISFSENIHRLDLNYRDKMRVAVELLNNLNSVSKVAKALGLTPPTIRNYLGYEGVPEELKKMVDKKRMSARTAMAISRSIPDEHKAVEIANRVREIPSTERRQTIIEIAKENPTKSVSDIVRLAKKQKFHKVTLSLTPKLSEALEAACRDYLGEPRDIATEALEEWLGNRGFLK